jgi:hypothetical protein
MQAANLTPPETPMDTPPTSLLSQPGRAETISLLASIYNAVDWNRQGGSSVLDRWSGMVMVAIRAETIGEFANNLCKRLGVGSTYPASDLSRLVEQISPHERDVLDWIDRETIPVAMMAYAKAKEERKR